MHQKEITHYGPRQKRQVCICSYIKSYPHQNIIEIHNIQFKKGLPTIYMQKCISLKSQQLQRLTFNDQVQFVIQNCKAFQYMYKHGIEHLDIKSINWVYLEEQHGGKTFKLIDFGMGKMYQIPTIFYQLQGIDQKSRKFIQQIKIEQDHQMNRTSVGQLMIQPPQIEKIKNFFHYNTFIRNTTDIWLLGIQFITLIFCKQNQNNCQQFFNNLNIKRDQIIKQIQSISPEQWKIYKLPIIQECSKMKNIYFLGNKRDQFIKDFLILIQQMFIFNIQQRITCKLFKVKFIGLLTKHKKINFAEIQASYKKQYNKDLLHYIAIEQSRMQADPKQQKLFTAIIKRQKQYFKIKHNKNQQFFEAITFKIEQKNKKFAPKIKMKM